MNPSSHDEPPRAERRRIGLTAALIAVVGLGVWASSFGGAFVLDDRSHIVGNPQIRSLTALPTLLSHATRPLVTFTLSVNYALSDALLGNGLDPLGYHLFNVAVHLLAALVLFDLVRRTLRRPGLAAHWHAAATGLAGAVALVWLVHPLNTQAVTYVIQRGESLMGLLYLLTLYAVLRSAEAREADASALTPAEMPDAPAVPASTRWAIAALACGWLGMLTKEVMVTVPIVLLLYDRAFLAGSFAAALRQRGAVYAGLALGSAVLTARALTSASGAPEGVEASAGFSMELHPWSDYALSQPAAVLRYLQLAVWPRGLTFDYGQHLPASPVQLALGGATVAVLGGLTLWALWRRPRLGFLGAWFFVILGPTSSVMPIADPVVEHRMYLPLIAVAAVAVLGVWWGLGRWGANVKARQMAAALLLVAAVAALGLTTAARNRVYHDPVALWQDTIAKAPQNFRAHQNLATRLFERDEMDAAAASYRRALELAPPHAEALVRLNLGRTLEELGQLDAAAEQYRTTLARYPGHAAALYELGSVLVQRGERAQAAALLREAVTQDPGHGDAWQDLGTVLSELNQLDEAIAAYAQAAALKPDDAALRNSWGVALARAGRLPEAAEQFAAAVALDPNHADARANLARARQMVP